jgi:hypothetical protein
MPLILTDLDVDGFGSIRCFDHSDNALEHLDKHVLSKPECQGWALLFGSVYDEIVGANRHAYANTIQNKPSEAQSLYDRYAEAIQRALNDASSLDWIEHPEVGDMAALGLDGVAVYVEVDTRGDDQQVKTAFLPGLGDSETTDEDRDAPLARETEGSLLEEDKRMERSWRERTEGWSRAETIYYTLFRRARSFIQNKHYRPQSPPGWDLPTNELVLLSDAVSENLEEAFWQIETDISSDEPLDANRNFRAWKRLRDGVR